MQKVNRNGKLVEKLVEPLSIPPPPHPLKCQIIGPLSWLSMSDRSGERSPGQDCSCCTVTEV